MKTTLEEAGEIRHNEIENDLQGLLEKNYDAEEGFKKAIEKTDNPDLKEYFKVQAVLRNRFATEISHEMHELNIKPKEKGSTTGTLHRTWMDIKAMFSSDDDESVLEECIRGEKESAEEYEKVLQHLSTPLQVENILKSQLDEIRATLATVKTLEDIAD